ncbi:MAG: hypothetical protein HWN80_01010 [Candidatus Lokiarchaeota archaeon]|nr:hypothetical protein [Candidatus Lokiarchaeota archaeon]
MDPIEEKKIVEEILQKRRLPYSIELLDIEGDKYTVRNNFGSTVEYFKKDDNYYLDTELD